MSAATDAEPVTVSGFPCVPAVDPTGIHLVYVWKDRGTRRLALEHRKEIVIGRSELVDLVIDEPNVSRRHAMIVWDERGITLEDLESRNGTRIGTEVVRGASRLLEPGATFSIGSLTVIVAATTVVSPRAWSVPPAGREARQSEIVPSGVGSAREADEAELPRHCVVADPKMREVFAFATRLASLSTTVLVLGETGVGKEVVAEFIHARGDRRDAPFIRLNSASIPESLLESELFGHEKGAFTGATASRVGHIEAANGGTLFLDEIGELAPATQVRLLRALENRTITRVGSTEEIPVDVRVICATHRDLPAMVAAGTFREDLYYRIAAFVLRVPPLRERRAEIPLLAELFLTDIAAQMGRVSPAFGVAAEVAMRSYGWPGNVRELRNVVEHALVLSDDDGDIAADHLPERVRGTTTLPPPPDDASTLDDHLSTYERRAIEDALLAEDGNQTRAARRLGITRRALIYRMAKLGAGSA